MNDLNSSNYHFLPKVSAFKPEKNRVTVCLRNIRQQAVGQPDFEGGCEHYLHLNPSIEKEDNTEKEWGDQIDNSGPMKEIIMDFHQLSVGTNSSYSSLLSLS